MKRETGDAVMQNAPRCRWDHFSLVFSSQAGSFRIWLLITITFIPHEVFWASTNKQQSRKESLISVASKVGGTKESGFDKKISKTKKDGESEWSHTFSLASFQSYSSACALARGCTWEGGYPYPMYSHTSHSYSFFSYTSHTSHTFYPYNLTYSSTSSSFT